MRKRPRFRKSGSFFFLQVAWHALWCAFPSGEPRRDIVRTIRGGKEIADGTFEMQNECAERDVSRNRTSPLLSRFFYGNSATDSPFLSQNSAVAKMSAMCLRAVIGFTEHRGSRNPLKRARTPFRRTRRRGGVRGNPKAPESADFVRFAKYLPCRLHRTRCRNPARATGGRRTASFRTFPRRDSTTQPQRRIKK